jgi:hypothetical protein
MRTMRLAEKKYMINSRGFFKRKEPISVSMPNTRKKRAKKAIRIFFPHQKHASIDLSSRRPLKQLNITSNLSISMSGSIVKRPHIGLARPRQSLDKEIYGLV